MALLPKIHRPSYGLALGRAKWNHNRSGPNQLYHWIRANLKLRIFEQNSGGFRRRFHSVEKYVSSWF